MVGKPWVLILLVVVLLLVQSVLLCCHDSGAVFDYSGELTLGSYVFPADVAITW